jgi:hypothetical protein
MSVSAMFTIDHRKNKVEKLLVPHVLEIRESN